MEDKFLVSASVLPTAHDCMRRGASKAFGARNRSESKFGKMIESAGYTFDTMKTGKSYAPILGTAIHAVVEKAIQQNSLASSLDAGMNSLYDNVEGAEGDSTTPTLAMAEHQLKLIGTYIYDHILPYKNVAFCEEHFTMPFGENIVISGHVDLGCWTDDMKLSIEDWKFGVNGKGYDAQIGIYSELAEHNGYTLADEHNIQHLPRPKKTIKHEVIPINGKKASSLAQATIKHIARAIKDFERLGDPDVFIANPASQLCSKKFCPAFGTEFCSISGEK